MDLQRKRLWKTEKALALKHILKEHYLSTQPRAGLTQGQKGYERQRPDGVNDRQTEDGKYTLYKSGESGADRRYQEKHNEASQKTSRVLDCCRLQRLYSTDRLKDRRHKLIDRLKERQTGF